MILSKSLDLANEGCDKRPVNTSLSNYRDVCWPINLARPLNVVIIMSSILAFAVWRHCIGFWGCLFGAKQGLLARLQGRIQNFGTGGVQPWRTLKWVSKADEATPKALPERV